MVIHDAVKVRNPHGLEAWVDRARLPELLAQGFEVVLDPKTETKEEDGPKAKQAKPKVKDGDAK